MFTYYLKYWSPAVQFLSVIRKLHGELTIHMLTCRAVPPCRSETTRGTYYIYAQPAVQFLPVARKLHVGLTTYMLNLPCSSSLSFGNYTWDLLNICSTCRAVPLCRSETTRELSNSKCCTPAVQFLSVVRKLHRELTIQMLTCRAVPLCRSETTRGTYYIYAQPAVQFLPVARKLHGELTTQMLQRRTGSFSFEYMINLLILTFYPIGIKNVVFWYSK